MNARGIVGFLAGLLVLGLIVGIGVGAYQLGVTQGIIDAGRFPAGADVPVAGYGYGWHGGPGIFGILVGLFFLFLLFGLLRAAFSRGRGWGPGWGGGPGGWHEERDRHVAEWHRRLHEAEGHGGHGGPGSSGASGAGGGPPR